MERWEKEYLHARAVRDAQAETIGLPVPQDEKYGTLTAIPKLWNRFKGKEFLENLRMKGHSTMDKQHCVCSEERTDIAILLEGT